MAECLPKSTGHNKAASVFISSISSKKVAMKRTLTARSFHFSCNGKLTRVACSQASVFSSSAHGISWSRYSHHAKSENDHGYVRIEQDGTEQGVFVVKLNRPDKVATFP